MGVFKKFIGGLAVESFQIGNAVPNYSGTRYVISFKNTAGTTETQYSAATSDKNKIANILPPFSGLIPHVTSDDISDYSLNDYAISDILPVTYSEATTIHTTDATKTFTINISNTTSNDATIKCVKFAKSYILGSGSTAYILICAYYLDAPLTIPAGESRTITIEMKVGTDVSVNET